MKAKVLAFVRKKKATREKRQLERVNEKSFCREAAKHKLMGVKMNMFGRRSWPDRLFLGAYRLIFFVEFKREGEEPTPQQADTHKFLRKWGFNVYVVDQTGVAEQIILAEKGFAKKCWLQVEAEQVRSDRVQA